MANQVVTPKSPNLPAAPSAYDAQYFNQYSNAIRLYFNQLDNANFITVNAVVNTQPKGYYLCTSSLAAAAANTPYAVTFDTTDTQLDYETSIGSPNSHIQLSRAGAYSIKYDAQILLAGSPPATVYLWLRLNGANVTNSGVTMVITSPVNSQVCVSGNAVLNIAAPSYLELVWATDSPTTIALKTNTATAFCPVSPAVKLSIKAV